VAGYVQARTLEMGQRYVGVLTDGAGWRAYHLRDGALVEVAALLVTAPTSLTWQAMATEE
jgi:hypothetical protein